MAFHQGLRTGLLTSEALASGGNRMLANMAPAELDLIAGSASRERMSRWAVMTEADVEADAIWFVEHGVASVIAPRPGTEKTELALIGPESFVGAPVIIGDGRWPYRTFVQVDVLDAIRWPLADARQAVEGSRILERILMHGAYAQMVQIAEGLISAAWERLDARLARWLLMYRERLGSDRLEVTHEFMAMMVGVQRTGVTDALHALEGRGLITSTRGLVVVRDAGGLREMTSRRYGVMEREQERLLLSERSSSVV